MMEFVRDALRGVRLMRRDPGFFTLAIAGMALGIGCLTAVFSVVYDVLLEPLPYDAAERLVLVHSVHPELGDNLLSRVETYAGIRESSTTLERVAALQVVDVDLDTADGTEPLQAAIVTPGFFELLDTDLTAGRGFLPDEGTYDTPRVAVLGHELWQRSFAGRTDLIGRSVLFTGDPALGGPSGQRQPLTVVGVLPPGFRAPFGSLDPQIWIADSFGPTRISAVTHAIVFGRLAPDTSTAAALEEVQQIYRRSQLQAGDRDSPWKSQLTPLRDFLVGPIRQPLKLLFLGGLCVLLVAAANTANLLLARAQLRAGEVAVRSALGARPFRLIRQMLAEGLAPALSSGVLGLALAWTSLRTTHWLDLEALPERFTPGIDWTVAGFVFVAILATQLFFAMVPAVLFSRLHLARFLEHRSVGSVISRRIRAGRSVLLTFQVGFALALAVASVLLLRSLYELRQVDPGFEGQGVLTASVSLPAHSYARPQNRAGFYARLLEAVRHSPDIQAAGLVSFLPFGGGSAATEVVAETAPTGSGDDGVPVEFRGVSPGYLEAMDIELLGGRSFNDRDLTRPAAIVSRKAAHLLWGPDEDPVGRLVKLGGRRGKGSWLPIVGVVDDVRHDSLRRDTQPTLYLPQVASSKMAMVARCAHGDSERLGAVLSRTVATLDPELALREVETMEDKVTADLGSNRITAWLMTLLGVVTLTLAVLGVYAATWQAVVERRSEIAVRCALGAQVRHIRRAVVGRAAIWLVLGLVLGCFGARVLGQYLSSLLFGVAADDWLLMLLTAAAVGCTVGLVGSHIPARRATRVDLVTWIRS